MSHSTSWYVVVRQRCALGLWDVVSSGPQNFDFSGGSSGGSNDQIDPGIGGVDVCDRIALGRQDVDSSGGGDGSGQGVLDSAGAMGWQCYNRSFENLPVNNFCGACSTKYTADVPHQKG